LIKYGDVLKRQISGLSFTPKYDELEDRIRLSVNYDDYSNRVDLLITRSFILKLFPILDEYLIKYYKSDLPEVELPINDRVTKDQEENISVSDGSSLELYKQEDELLLEINFSFIKENSKTLVQFVSKSSVTTAQLDEKSLKQVFSIIKTTVPFFSWGISQNF